MGYALRKHDEDLEVNEYEEIVDFGEHKRHGWFKVIIPSNEASNTYENSLGLCDECTVYMPINVSGAGSLLGMSFILLQLYLF